MVKSLAGDWSRKMKSEDGPVGKVGRTVSRIRRVTEDVWSKSKFQDSDCRVRSRVGNKQGLDMGPPWCCLPAEKDECAACLTKDEVLKNLTGQLIRRMDPVVLKCSLRAPGPVAGESIEPFGCWLEV